MTVEYRVVDIEYREGTAELEEQLNKLGEDGWGLRTMFGLRKNDRAVSEAVDLHGSVALVPTQIYSRATFILERKKRDD